MHSVAARIALLAYLVGGMIVPVLHRHDSGSSSHGSAAHAHGSAAHAHGGCSHQDHSHAPGSASEDASDVLAEGGGAALATAAFASAPSERTAVCSDNCVVCSFTGSPQSAAPVSAAAFAAIPGLRITVGPIGPGFEAFAYEQNRLRGPPVSMILG